MNPKLLEKLLKNQPEEIAKEDYNEFDSLEPRNFLADKLNPAIQKYINPVAEKVLPDSINQDLSIPKLSRGEAQELIRDMPQDLGAGFSGGLTNVGSRFTNLLRGKAIDAIDNLKGKTEKAEILNPVRESLKKDQNVQFFTDNLQKSNSETLKEAARRAKDESFYNSKKATQQREAQNKAYDEAKAEESLIDKLNEDYVTETPGGEFTATIPSKKKK